MNTYRTFILLFAFATAGINGNAQEKNQLFRDTTDNAIDLSYYLVNLHGLLPVISPITEPAVGYGAAGGLIYFIPKKTEKPGFHMPDMVMGIGGYTQSNSWAAGGGYIGFWNEDKLRYRGFIGYGQFHLKYFGNGSTVLANNPLRYTLSSKFLLQQLETRLGESHFFVGAKYVYTQTTITLFDDNDISFLDPRDIELTNSGITLIAEYENFDNMLSPNAGARFNLSYNQHMEILGSDKKFGKLRLFTSHYLPVSKLWTPGLRTDINVSTGETPFYALPFIELRGVPMQRYQGELTLSAETEHQFNLSPRWSLIGFAGLGTTSPQVSEINFSKVVWNAGTGFRYLLARVFGLKMGMDFAKSSDDWAFYVVFGSAWTR